jgi:hypothetical protein
MTKIQNKVYSGSVFNNRRILCAIVDQANIRTKHNKLFKKVYDITFAYTSRHAASFNGDVIFFNTIDDAMESSNDYDLVIIQSVGNFIKFNSFFEEVNNYWNKNPNFFIISFTLDWDAQYGEGWVECHHQMIVVNVNTWKSLQSPIFGGWGPCTEHLPNYSRSVENFHDKYTPYWIKGEPGFSIKTRSKQGWNFIKTALEAGIQIDNFNESMRDSRLYIYPEVDSELLYQGFMSGNSSSLSNFNQKKCINGIQHIPCIWVYNSEHYRFDVDISTCDTYFGPAAGFKYLDALNYNPNIEFIFYDFNQASLDWIEDLKNNWDGEDFGQYLKSKSLEIQKLYKFVNGSIEKNQQILLKEFGGQDNFKRLWNLFKQSKTTFVRCDIFSQDDITTVLSNFKGEKFFFYYSNIFATDYIIFKYSLDELNEYYDLFLKNISSVGSSISVGTSPLGKWELLKNE